MLSIYNYKANLDYKYIKNCDINYPTNIKHYN